MTIVNYSKTCIYKIVCKDSSVTDVFFKATTDLRKIKTSIRNSITAGKESELFSAMRASGGIDNWNFLLLEHFSDCKSKHESNSRVEYWRNQELSKSTAKFTPSLRQIYAEDPPNLRQANSVDQTTQNGNKKRYECEKCAHLFTRKDSLTRHLKDRCKGKRDYAEIEEENKELRTKCEELQKKVDDADKQIVTKNMTKNVTTNNNANVHNANVLNNNSHNTINNNVQINLMPFGHENYADVLTEAEKLAILSQKHKTLEYKVKYVRCNEKFPEWRNVAITNLRSGVAHVYNDTASSEYVTMPLDYVLELIISADCTEIESDLDELGHKLDAKTRKHTGEFLRQVTDDPTKTKQQKQLIKQLLYNHNKNLNLKV